MIKCPRVTALEGMVCLHYKPLLSVMNKMLPGSVKYSGPLCSQALMKMKANYSQKSVSLLLAKGF